MASLTVARPGKLSERHYLGDLSGLFERQRRRVGVALTPESFAADLAANDTLRSGLFTLCSAISRMGESDLSPEGLLDLIARALGEPGASEGEPGTNVPRDMREAFLSGYAAWQRRDVESLALSQLENWPSSDERKPPAPEAIAHSKVADQHLSFPTRPSPGRRTVPEALGLVHGERAADAHHSDSLSQLRLIPFPTRRGKSADELHENPRSADIPPDSASDALVRRRSASSTNSRTESAVFSPVPAADDRPPGIDALLAAAPAWASSTPTARSFDEDPVPARPIAVAAPFSAPLFVQAVPALEPAGPPPIGLDPVDDARRAPIERLQEGLFSLPPRNIFLVLAGLTVLAGGLASWMAYQTMHSGHAPELKDLDPMADFGPAPPATQPSVTVQTGAATSSPAVKPKPSAAQGPAPPASQLKPHVVPVPLSRDAVWPPAPQQLARNSAPAPLAAASLPDATTPGQRQSLIPSYVPAPTMIGYALATPQPAYPAALARGITGTVAVEITVSRLGDVISARAVSGPPELRGAATAAVRGWRFRPYLTDGKPIEVSTTLQFFFNGQ